MEPEPQKPEPAEEYPIGSTVITQSSWAWIWPGIPWVILAVISAFWDAISFGLFPLILAVAVILPRYMGWRSTRYVLTPDHLILQRGVLGGSHKYEVPVTDFRRITVKYGWFGKSLGYEGVDVVLRGGGKANMSYVPASAGVAQRVHSMMLAAGITPDPDPDPDVQETEDRGPDVRETKDRPPEAD